MGIPGKLDRVPRSQRTTTCRRDAVLGLDARDEERSRSDFLQPLVQVSRLKRVCSTLSHDGFAFPWRHGPEDRPARCSFGERFTGRSTVLDVENRQLRRTSSFEKRSDVPKKRISAVDPRDLETIKGAGL